MPEEASPPSLSVESFREHLETYQKQPFKAHRWLHGRGGRLEGLEQVTLDVYGSLAVVMLYRSYTPESRDELLELCQSSFERGVLQDRAGRPEILRWSWGEVEERELVSEVLADELAAMKIYIEPMSRQNLGFFPDMSAGRRWAYESSRSKRVLNLFSYTCSLSVACCLGGAHSVVNVDMSGSALSRGRDNHRLNDLHDVDVQYLKLDILKSWGRISRKGPYDLVICDPPTQQKGGFLWKKDYPKVMRRLAAMVGSGVLGLFCLNAPYVSREEFEDLLLSGELGGLWAVESWLNVDEAYQNLEAMGELKLLVLVRR